MSREISQTKAMNEIKVMKPQRIVRGIYFRIYISKEIALYILIENTEKHFKMKLGLFATN